MCGERERVREKVKSDKREKRVRSMVQKTVKEESKIE